MEGLKDKILTKNINEEAKVGCEKNEDVAGFGKNIYSVVVSDVGQA